MSDSWNIVHITDLHIADPAGGNEHLRLAYYDEYLDGLAGLLRAHSNEAPDCIVVTGDAVDRGNASNYAHATTVLSHLCDRLEVDRSRVVLCSGNHDVVRALDKDDQRAARAAFIEFANGFAQRQMEPIAEWGAIFKIGDDIHCIMLDATRRDTTNSEEHDGPGIMTDLEVDDIMKWVKAVPKDSLLVVGSHYPTHEHLGRLAAFDDENPRWHARHFWSQASGLRERLSQRRTGLPTVWLCGDIHVSGHVREHGVDYAVTGRLGCRTSNDGQVRRQARMIRLVKPAHSAEPRSSSLLAEFELPTHRNQTQIGSWTLKNGKFVTPNEIAAPRTVLPASPDPEPPDARGQPLNDGIAPQIGVATKLPETIDVVLERAILDTIRRENLYHFGRFETAPGQTSLGWVSIGPLVNAGEILSGIVTAMVCWLRNQSLRGKKHVLLGLDCWGAVLASQISVATGAPHFCVASRGRGRHTVEGERIDTTLVERLVGCESIVLVSDVVATGRSLGYVRDEILRAGAGRFSVEPHWLALSIISDAAMDRDECAFLAAHGTACSSLRLPILPSSALPDTSVLPATLTFSTD